MHGRKVIDSPPANKNALTGAGKKRARPVRTEASGGAFENVPDGLSLNFCLLHVLGTRSKATETGGAIVPLFRETNGYDAIE
jgi:hypothetical protein